MRRLAMLVALGSACAADEPTPDCPGLGCPGTGTGTASEATSVATTTGTTTSSPGSSSETSSDASSTPGNTAGSSESTAAATGTAEASSSEGTSEGACRGADCPALAECFGLGVWQSCAQYCDALDAVCVAGGCDGATIVYYDDADACIALESSGESDQSCDAGFMQGGGVSFGRCCCD